MPFTDDPGIGAEELLLRRIPQVQWVYDGTQQRVRPSSAAFADHELSVDVAGLHVAAGRTVEAPLEGHAGCALASIAAGDARQRAQIVCLDPEPNNAAHALVVGKKTSGDRKHFARISSWVVDPSTVNPDWRPEP